MPTTTTGVATTFINFTRASNATVTDSNGLIDWAAHNLLLASEQFDASNWSKTAATVAANAIAAPNGTTTADTLTSTGSGCYVLQSYSAISGTITVSVFAKPGTNSSVVLRAAQAGNGYETSFTLSGSGTAGTPTIIGTGGTVSGMTASISSLADSWYLCTIRFAETGLGNVFIMQTATSGTIHLWGAHLYRSDMGMQANTSAYPMYNPTTPKNLLGYTEDFSNAYWQKAGTAAFGSGSVANASVAPNGLQTADLITTDTSNGYHVVYGAAVSLPGGVAMHSWYVKPNGYTKVAIRENGASGYYGTFNLSGAGSVLDSTATYVTAAVTSLSDGWYRISARITNATSQQAALWILPDSYTSGTPVFMWTANGTSGIYLWGAQLSDSASLDPYVPVYGAAVTSAAYYGPRRDFDPVTLACKGLLVEEQRANLLTYSNTFNNVIWSSQNQTVATSGSTTGPDGVAGAFKITGDTSNTEHFLENSFGVLTNQTYTASLYAKADSGVGYFSVSIVAVGSPSTVSYLFIQNNAGVLSTASQTGIISSNSVTPVGGGWYRIAVTYTLSGTVTSHRLRIYSISLSNNPVTTGNGTSGVAIYGSQVEAGSFATSYIPTTTASATRSADVAQVSTAAFPYSATEGTFVVSGDSFSATRDGKFLSITDGTASGENNCFTLDVLPSSKTRFIVAASGSTQANFTSTASYTPNSIVKIAGAYKQNDFGGTSNGEAITTDTTGNVPAVSVMEIGFHRSGSPLQWINGHIRQITYIPRRLSNAELQARTV